MQFEPKNYDNLFPDAQNYIPKTENIVEKWVNDNERSHAFEGIIFHIKDNNYEEAQRLLEMFVDDKSHPSNEIQEAHFLLGIFNLYGTAGKKSVNEGMAYLENGNAAAKFTLGIIYLKNLFSEDRNTLAESPDLEKAVSYFTKAMGGGDKRALVALGYIAFEKKEFDSAIQYLDMASTEEEPNPQALYLLGYICWIENELEAAVNYLKLADDLKVPQASIILAHIRELKGSLEEDLTEVVANIGERPENPTLTERSKEKTIEGISKKPEESTPLIADKKLNNKTLSWGDIRKNLPSIGTIVKVVLALFAAIIAGALAFPIIALIIAGELSRQSVQTTLKGINLASKTFS